MIGLVNNLTLPESYISALISLRRELHKNAELSGAEKKTRRIILDFISSYVPHKVIAPIGGGYGLACIYQAETHGPTLLFRAEMDALPMVEKNDVVYKSLDPNASHLCGHDGQMTICAGLSGLLARHPIKRGRIILLFQPAEETGQGARKIINDPAFKKLAPDYAFALHNMPGKETGAVFIKSGAFNAASTGMIIKLTGKTAHASHPEDGLNPTLSMCEIIQELTKLPSASEFKDIFSLLTVVFARLGKGAFGTAPGEAEIQATLRCQEDRVMVLLKKKAEQLVSKCAADRGLQYQVKWCEKFSTSVNDRGAVEVVAAAAKRAGLKVVYLKRPRRWSEDFGQFTARFPGAMFLLGAGQICPPLHSPEYDFPDELIEIGLAIYWEIINHVLKR